MSKPTVKPVADRADLWREFQRLAPELFDEGGDLRQPPPVQDVLKLIARAERDRSNEALPYGVYRLAHREGDSFSPADSALIQQAVERLRIEPYATAKPAPRTPTRWKRVAEAAVLPSGPTILFEQPGGQTMTRSEIVELKLTETSSGGILVWEIQLNRVTDLASLKRFVSRCWGSAGRQDWLNGRRLFVQFSGKGIINADPNLVQAVLANALPTAKEVILVLPPQPAEALPASSTPSEEVRRLLAELRALPAARYVGLSRQTTQEIRRIRGLWALFYASLDAPEISAWVWRRQSRILASRMVRHLPPASRSNEIISALTRALYEELAAVRREERAGALGPLPGRTDWSEATLATLRPKATELIAEVRSRPSVMGKLPTPKAATAAQIEKVWNHFYDSLTTPEVPKKMWQELAQRFAKKIAAYIPQERLTGEIMFLLATADVVYQEAEQTFRESAYQGTALAKALTSLSPREIIELSGKYPSSLLHVAFSLEDPIRKAEQFDQNRQRAEAYLNEHGFGNRAKGISTRFYVFAAPSAEMAELRALELAKAHQTGKLEVEERVETEPPPPPPPPAPPPPPSSPEELLAQVFEQETRTAVKLEMNSIGEIFKNYYAGLAKPEISEDAWNLLIKQLSRRVASYRTQVEVSDKLVGDLAQHLYEDFVVAKGELDLDETLLAEALGKWTLAELRELAAHLAPERLRTAVRKTRLEALIQLRIRRVDRQRGSATEPTPQPSTPFDPAQPSEESARQIIAAVRGCEDRKGFISEQAKPFRNRMLSLWNEYYSEVTDPAVPKDLWLQTGKTFGLLATRLIGHLEVSDSILKQVAHAIYGEIHQVLTALKGRGTQKAIRYGITKLEATQIIEFYRIFPGTLAANIITHSDAKGEMARRLGYYQSAQEHLERLGFQDIPPKVIGRACWPSTIERVQEEAERLAKKFVAEKDFWMQKGLSEEAARAKAETRVSVMPSISRGAKLYSGPAIVQEVWERTENWWQATQGERLPATPQTLKRFGLAEPATIRGRLIRYGPAEGIPGLIAVFAAPAVTQSILGINPHRQVASFHIANLGVMHMLNATGGAIADVIPQVRRGRSAIQLGNQVVTSPSLGRTFLRSFAYRTGAVAGLAEGVVWAYPGYFVGAHSSGLITENPTVQAIAGGTGAVGLPLGLRIWLGKKGMEKLAQSVLGKMTAPAAAAMLSNDFILWVQESYLRRNLTDEAINLREKALEATPWHQKLIANLRVFFALSGYDPAAELFESKPRLEQALERREEMIKNHPAD